MTLQTTSKTTHKSTASQLEEVAKILIAAILRLHLKEKEKIRDIQLDSKLEASVHAKRY